MGPLYEAALEYAARGLPVFPCQPRGKNPACARGTLDATTDVARINGWWGAIGELNIGLATGKASGFFVCDIDNEEGQATLRTIEEAHGALPPTVETITGRGRHLYFSLGEHKIRNSVGKLGSGIDVRGDGGYVLAPPSVHPSGRLYTRSVDSADQFAEAPGWLHKLVDNDRSRQGKPLEHWHNVLTGRIPEGTRNSTLASVCGKLVHFGLSDVVLLFDLMLCINDARCNPPLTYREVDNIISSVLRSHLRKLCSDE
jgi:putative DNA primase/helicase